MKWIIMITALAFSAIACEKSTDVQMTSNSVMSQESQEAPARKLLAGMPIVGTWDLVEYYTDNGNGSGIWQTVDFLETISFSADGSFKFSKTFPLYSYNYTSYATDNDGFIFFFPSHFGQEGMGDSYHYMMESSTQLVFFPVCRESCPRRYQLRQAIQE